MRLQGGNPCRCDGWGGNGANGAAGRCTPVQTDPHSVTAEPVFVGLRTKTQLAFHQLNSSFAMKITPIVASERRLLSK